MSGSMVPLRYSSENSLIVSRGKSRRKANQKKIVLKKDSTTVTSVGPWFRIETPA